MVACFFYLVSFSYAVVTCRGRCDLGDPELVKLFPKEALQNPGRRYPGTGPPPAKTRLLPNLRSCRLRSPPPRSRQPPRLPPADPRERIFWDGGGDGGCCSLWHAEQRSGGPGQLCSRQQRGPLSSSLSTLRETQVAQLLRPGGPAGSVVLGVEWGVHPTDCSSSPGVDTRGPTASRELGR